jgi:hypothetical protein
VNGQLHIWPTLREAYTIFFTELPTFLRIGIKPFICLFALMGLFTVLKIQSPGSFSVTLLISVLALIFFGALALSPFAVSCHRLVLTDERPETRSFFRMFRRREIQFAKFAVFLTFVGFSPLILSEALNVWSWVEVRATGSSFLTEHSLVHFWILVLLVISFLPLSLYLVRFVFIFPQTAMDERATLTLSAKQTRNARARLLFIFVLVDMPFILSEMILRKVIFSGLDDGPWALIADAIHVLLYLLNSALLAIAISLTFRARVLGQELGTFTRRAERIARVP